MPLTPEEQKELAALQAKYQPKPGLTPEEQSELDQLKQRFRIGSGFSASVPQAVKSLVGAAQAVRGGVLKGATLDNLPDSANPVEGYAQAAQDAPIPDKLGRLIGSTGVSGAAGLGMGQILPKAAGILPSLARMGGNIGLAGLLGAAKKPQGEQTRMDNAIDQAASPWTLGGAAVGEAANALAPSVANSMMKRAVGVVGAKSKNAPADLGTTLINEGIIGTKGQMASQADQKYGEVENLVQSLADGIKEKTPSNLIGDKVGSLADGRHILSDAGEVIPGHSSDVDAIQQRASELSQLGGAKPASGALNQIPAEPGMLSGKDLLQLKRGGDWEGFANSGSPATGTQAQIGRTQADAARQQLATLSGGAMPDALKREQALLLADKALRAPTMTYKNPVSLSDIGAGLVGGESHGLPGASAGILASKAAVSPFAQSVGAHGAAALGQPGGASSVVQALLNGIFAAKGQDQ